MSCDQKRQQKRYDIDLLNEKNDIDWENQLNQLNMVCELL
jgi:predicted transcriptional regulator